MELHRRCSHELSRRADVSNYYTRTHTHMHTHSRTVYTHIYAYIYVYIYTCVITRWPSSMGLHRRCSHELSRRVQCHQLLNTHTHTHTYIHTLTHMYIYTNIHIQICDITRWPSSMGLHLRCRHELSRRAQCHQLPPLHPLHFYHDSKRRRAGREYLNTCDITHLHTDKQRHYLFVCDMIRSHTGSLISKK